MTDPDLGIWYYEYPNGNMTKQTDARGMDIDITYDALNRIEQKDSDASDNLSYNYVYGAHNDSTLSKRGCLLSVTGAEGSTNLFTRTLNYDALGRVASTQLSMDGHTWTSYSTYDALNRVKIATIPNGEIITNTYNDRGSLTRVAAGNDVYLDDASYLESGAIDQLDYGNNTSVVYDYDGTGATPSYRLNNVSVTGGTVDFDLTYEYNSIGNITSITDSVVGKNQTFTYDGINRILTATGVYGAKSYTYDKAGNILTKDGNTYSYDTTRNRLNTEGIWTYSYDVNGNITSRTDGTDTQDFVYDSMNRLIEFDDGTSTDSYEYTEGESRLKKVEDGQTTYYISGAYEEIYSGSTLDETFIRYGSYAIRDSEGLKYRYSDHLGSSSRIANISGTESRAIWHSPFGDETASTGTAKVKYKYTGKEEDLLELYYYGARYFDPTLGRFMSADSIIPDEYNPMALNRYAYVINNPLRYTDPDGHFFKEMLFPHQFFGDSNYSPTSGEAVSIDPLGYIPPLDPYSAVWDFAIFVHHIEKTSFHDNESSGASSTTPTTSDIFPWLITSGNSSAGALSPPSADPTRLSVLQRPSGSTPIGVDLSYLDNAGSGWGEVTGLTASPAPPTPTPLQSYNNYQKANHATNSSGSTVHIRSDNHENQGFKTGTGGRRFNFNGGKQFTIRKTPRELAANRSRVNGHRFRKCAGNGCGRGPTFQYRYGLDQRGRRLSKSLSFEKYMWKYWPGYRWK